eukprot:1353398-Ditylum_brightwellii.AAC.1
MDLDLNKSKYCGGEEGGGAFASCGPQLALLNAVIRGSSGKLSCACAARSFYGGGFEPVAMRSSTFASWEKKM